MRIASILLLSLAALVSSAAAVDSSPPAVTYVWRTGGVYRFEYNKTITVEQPDTNGKPQSEVTSVSGVLIIEIRTVTTSGALGTLRLDAPRVTLPEIMLFSSQFNQPELQKDKHRVLARAMEAAIKNARWNVTLSPAGVVQIDGRTPQNFREWMKEVENTGGWRKKSIEKLTRLVEEDLGLKTKGVDDDLLPCLQSGAVAADGGDAAKLLRPRRGLPRIDTAAADRAVDTDKASLTFKRIAPEKEGSFRVPDLSAQEKLDITFKGVETSDGTAVFDTKLGMVDTFSEDFTATLDYSLGKLALTQKVRVQYKLRRLAPAIVKP